MDMANFITVSMMLSGISGMVIGFGDDKERVYGIALGLVALIMGVITQIANFVLGVDFILWLIAIGLATLFQSNGAATKGTGRVGVGVPGASYPLGGFKKPTIKNMTRWD